MSTEKSAAFFYEHAGYSWNPQTQTREEGRAQCARALAEAEEVGRERGLSFRWEVDPDVTSADWKGNREDGGKYRNPWATWCCTAYDADGRAVAHLGGIDFGRDVEPWGQPYRRVVEAELAREALQSPTFLED